MMTLPKSGWPVRGHTEVNSVAVRVTAWISGAGKASALRYSRASPGVDGRGSGPVRGSLGFCSFIDRAPQLISVCFHDHSCIFGNVMTSPATSLRYQRYTSDRDRKSTRLNSSHVAISYAVFCLKKKKKK